MTDENTSDIAMQTKPDEPAEPRKRGRGFASLTPEQRRAISSKGGKSAHAQGVAHKWTSEQARAAGKNGGTAPHKRRGRTTIVPPAPPPEGEPSTS